MSDEVEIGVADDEDSYIVTTRRQGSMWLPSVVYAVVNGERKAVASPAFLPLAGKSYPTPGLCLNEMARIVVAELFGVRT
jgi:hypothetical protein